MRSLGLQNSLTCEGVLQSARSIEAAFAPPILHIGNGGSSGPSTAQIAKARDAAVSRSRKLLDFVDHRADNLLLASGESGRWFVDPPPSLSGADINPRVENETADEGDVGGDGGVGRGVGGVGGVGGGGDDDRGKELSVSSASESGGDGSDYEGEDEGSGAEDAEEEGEDRIREDREMEMRQREKEKEERDRRRAEAVAAAARQPPPNDFVEELASIAWLPVHVMPPDDLLPWKVTAVRLPRVCV